MFEFLKALLGLVSILLDRSGKRELENRNTAEALASKKAAAYDKLQKALAIRRKFRAGASRNERMPDDRFKRKS